MERNQLAVVTSSKWILDGAIYWLTVKTDQTGEREYRKIGINASDHARGYRSEYTDSFAKGAIIKIGDLNSVPIKKWDLLACIEPGINIHVGEMFDGLTDICPRLIFWQLLDNLRGVKMTDEYKAVAYQAAMSGSEKAARDILEQSGLFQDIYTFRVEGPALHRCTEVT